MEAVIARHYPNAGAHGLGLGVHIVAVHGDSAGAELPGAGEHSEQHGVARGRRPDHRGQCARPCGERDVGEKLAPINGKPHMVCGNADRACSGLERQLVGGVRLFGAEGGARGTQRSSDHPLDQTPALWLLMLGSGCWRRGRLGRRWWWRLGRRWWWRLGRWLWGRRCGRRRGRRRGRSDGWHWWCERSDRGRRRRRDWALNRRRLRRGEWHPLGLSLCGKLRAWRGG